MPRTKSKKQTVFVVSEIMDDGTPQIHGVFTNANRAAQIQVKHKTAGAGLPDRKVFMSTVVLNEEDFVARAMK